MTYNTLGKVEKEFVFDCMAQLWDQKISVKLLAETSVEGCSGWFDSYNNEFVVATKSSQFFPVFLHEFNHFRQWIENPVEWDKNSDHFEYFGRKTGQGCNPTKYIQNKLRKSAICILEIEMDCERRTIQMIKDWNFDIDLDDYMRSSNAYLWVYGFASELCKWVKYPVYGDPNITKEMPLAFYKPEDYLKIKELDPKLYELYLSKF